jgi:antirestriction protein
MTLTLTVSYRETLASETVAKIDELVESQYELTDMLVFIDEHNEEDFREYYEDYVEVGENHSYQAVDYFVNEVADLSELARFEDAYIGEYTSPEDMAQSYCEDENDRLFYIVPDWEATAEYLLSHDIDRHGDHYFRCYY